MHDNTSGDVPNFVSHLECSLTGAVYPAGRVANLSDAGKPLLVRYDLPRLKSALTKVALLDRAPDLWRYREFLPVRRASNIVSLGETMTPLIAAPAMAERLGGGEILIKDEGRLPTGSFKSRGIAVAVSMARELGITRMAMPTAGNAGAALAAYCTRAGIESYIFCPEDAPDVTVAEIGLLGGRAWRVNGIITELAPIIEGGKAELGWFNASTLKEPYRVEGKKTMGLELAEQSAWHLPDAIFYPTGGGTGLIGMWKAFDELEAIGWIGGKRPRMIAVQSASCAPIVRAFDEGAAFAAPWENGRTSVPGLRVPATIGDFLILRVLRESNGFGIAIADEDVEPARAEIAAHDGIHLCPEGAATLVAYKKALAEGRIGKTDRVVLFNCASGLKYPMPAVTRKLDRHKPIDYRAL
ncbi:MAG: threonine synthase [Alphaproteobacteria bacterium]|nr:threonine synthase [Alphaproteobacteria bacterium]